MKLNQNRLLKLLSALVIIIAIFFIRSELPNIFPEKLDQPFVGIDKDQVKEIVFNKNEATTVYKKGNAWYVKKDGSEFKADQERINRIIASILNLKKNSIVSNNINKHKDLGIDKQKIDIKIAGRTYSIYIGNATGLANNYIRIDKENDVFPGEGLIEVFTPADYRNLSIPLVTDESKIDLIEINNNDRLTTLFKKDNDWKIGDKLVKSDRIDFYINDLKNLKANDIYPKDYPLPDIPPSDIIKIKESTKEKSINFYPQNENYYLAKISESEFIYQIQTAYVASLKKETGDFLD